MGRRDAGELSGEEDVIELKSFFSFSKSLLARAAFRDFNIYNDSFDYYFLHNSCYILIFQNLLYIH